MKEHHTHHYIFSTIGLLCVASILYFAWAAFIDGKLVNPPLDVYEQKENVQIITDKLVYEQGEVVRGLIKYCKNRQLEATYQWTLVDTYLKFFPEKTSNAVIGCHEVLIEIEQIPNDQYPDTDLYFETVFRYQINPFNEVTVPIRSNSFRVR